MRNLVRFTAAAAAAVAAAAGCTAPGTQGTSVLRAAALARTRAAPPRSPSAARPLARTAASPPGDGLHALLADDSAATLPGAGTHPLSIVTLYAAPSDAQWTAVEDSAPTVAGAIVNICDSSGNGPGCDNTEWTTDNTGWDSTVSALTKAGITPLIYLTTDNGTDPVSTLEAELARARQWWGITTPMFDQMTGTEGSADNGSGICSDGGANISCESYYQQLYNDAMANGAQAVMFNPGTWYGMSPAFVYGPFEILQGFENSQAVLTANSAPAPAWADQFGQFQFTATVSAVTRASVPADISAATARQHAGFIYADDEAEPPGYATLPSWFSAFLASLRKASLADRGSAASGGISG
jgi:hypothetical protein